MFLESPNTKWDRKNMRKKRSLVVRPPKTAGLWLPGAILTSWSHLEVLDPSYCSRCWPTEGGGRVTSISTFSSKNSFWSYNVKPKKKSKKSRMYVILAISNCFQAWTSMFHYVLILAQIPVSKGSNDKTSFFAHVFPISFGVWRPQKHWNQKCNIGASEVSRWYKLF